MRNPNNQRRAIGLLAIIATVLTVMAIWDPDEIEH